MLEGLATWFLNNYLGKYLKNLNTDQLTIALLQGEVELENVPLRRDALRFFNAALDVRSGFVGRIKLKIPVSRIRSEPWSLVMEKVYVVVGPQKFEDYDPEHDDLLNQELKLAALDAIEAEWRAEHESLSNQSQDYSNYSSWLSFGTSFIGTIIENLQIQIRDVHVRYEDDISRAGHPFACGFIVQSLAAQTCDDTWTPKFILRSPDEIYAYKIVQLQGMSCYLEKDAEIFGDDLDLNSLKEKMKTHMATDKKDSILVPVNATATLKRNCSQKPLNSKKQPRIHCNLNIESVPMEITKEQYQYLIIGSRTLHKIHLNKLYWKWRPSEPVNGNARLWWQYAITCHMERIHETNEKLRWSNVITKARENVKYLEAFKAYLRNPVAMDAKLRFEKDSIDLNRSYDELKALRDLAVFQLKKEKIEELSSAKLDASSQDNQARQSLLQYYFPSWYGSTASPADPKDEIVPSSSPSSNTEHMTPLEEEFLEALADDVNVVPYKDVVFAHISFTWKQGTLKLFSERSNNHSRSPLFELEFNNMKIEWESRPRTKSYKFSLSLGAVYLRNMLTKDSLFPLLMSPQSVHGAPLNLKAPGGAGRSSFGEFAKSISNYLSISSAYGSQPIISEEPLFSVLFETRPFNLGPEQKKVDFRLHVKSQPLNIVYNPSVLRYVSDFFQLPDELERLASFTSEDTVFAAAYDRIEEAKERTKAELVKNINSALQGGLSEKKTWDLEVELSAPQFLIPEHFFNKDALIMVIDLGKLNLTNRSDTYIQRKEKMQNLRAANSELDGNEDEGEDEDEEFCTPASTPGSLEDSELSTLESETITRTQSNFQESSNPTQGTSLRASDLANRIYDRFRLSMNGMQVIVGKVKDNWKTAYTKGTSSLHVLDKFSITMQLDRRVVPVHDSNWPNIVVSGTLPRLVMHVNEEKVFGIQRMVNLVLGNHESTSVSTSNISTQTEESNSQWIDEEDGRKQGSDGISLFSDWNQIPSINDGSKLLLLNFCVADMSVELQSQGKSIAELQVTGVRASLTKRPFDTSVTLSVHSLLLVDAIQTFGPNFELLVASHRHVMVDSVSGSLLGSEPVSPISPVSPDPFVQRYVDTTPVDLSNALSSLQKTSSTSLRHQRAVSPGMSKKNTSSGFTSPMHGTACDGSTISGLLDIADPDALIVVDILIVSPNCPSNSSSSKREEEQIISIQFNSLDVIANQETIIELLAFFKKIFPDTPHSSQTSKRTMSTNQSIQTEEMAVQRTASLETLKVIPNFIPGFSTDVEVDSKSFSKVQKRMQISADFQRLNVLLLRAVTGKMIGTALLTAAHINATLSNNISISGSLGGLQVMNLLTGSTLHQKVLSVGKDRTTDDGKEKSIHDALYDEEEKPAFSFTIEESSVEKDDEQSTSFAGTPMKESEHISSSFFETHKSEAEFANREISVSLEMASVCYVHSANFVEELNSCASDFKYYIGQLAQTIRMAATEIALGIVHRKAEALFNQSFMDDTSESPSRFRRETPRGSQRSQYASFGAGNYNSLDRGRSHSTAASKIAAPAPTPRLDIQQTDGNVEVKLDVLMETPVIVIPRHERSFEVLVANLGRISVRNEVIVGKALPLEEIPNIKRIDRLVVSISEMNMHSLNLLDKFEHYREDSLHLLSHFRHLTSQNLYSCTAQVAIPILHETAIEIHLEKQKRRPCNVVESASYNSFMLGDFDLSLANMDSDGLSAFENVFQFRGKIINPLKVTLLRSQYEQIIDSVKAVTSSSNIEEVIHSKQSTRKPSFKETDFDEENFGSFTTYLEGSFEVPKLIVELRGELFSQSSKVNSIVRAECEDFAVYIAKHQANQVAMEIALKSLVMEDLTVAKDSKHRKLMTSTEGSSNGFRSFKDISTSGLATSCPDWRAHPLKSSLYSSSSSLPTKLESESLFNTKGLLEKEHQWQNKHFKKPSLKQDNTGGNEPATPPPSASSSRASPIFREPIRKDLQNAENLVHIKVLDIDQKSPDFSDKYNCTNRFVEVDFNTLDINFNLQTWVIVLDFFGIGSRPTQAPAAAPITHKISYGKYQEPSKQSLGEAKSSGTSVQNGHYNTEIDIKVRALSMILNKPNYEVALASVKSYISRVSLRDGNFSISGKLRSFSIKDLTENGFMYRDRFISRGENILSFHIFKYGTDDEKLERPFDVKVKLRMASIVYVHTHRFYNELLAFFNEFHQLQTIMSRIREAAAGEKVKELAARGSRVHLDIEAGSPLLLVPMSSHSSKILVVDLGFLEINNTFMFSGDPGTISAESLASATASEVLSRPRGTTTRSSRRSASSAKSQKSSRSQRKTRSHLKSSVFSEDETDDEISTIDEPKPEKDRKCLLDVLNVRLSSGDLKSAERLSVFTDEDFLSNDDIKVGSFIVKIHPEPLLKQKFEVKLQIERNLDKAFSHRVPDVSVQGVLSRLHIIVDQEQYKLIRGLLGYNFGEPIDDLDFQTPTNEFQDPQGQTLLSGQVWTCILMNFELQDVIVDLLLHHERPPFSKEVVLARANLIKSRLVFESFSDSSKDVDLVSREILLNDLRFIDFPANKRTNVFTKILQPMVVAERNNPLQAEVHFRSNEEANRFTILINNMRLMGIFDWWLAVLDFISKYEENPCPVSKEHDLKSINKSQEKRHMAHEEPLYPTAGVISRRDPVVQSSGPVFELKLNITDSESIIVADSSQLDTSTVILRSTTVLAFRPSLVDRPFSCNLNNVEVVSCILGKEEESGLSIIDPVTINFEIGGRPSSKTESKGLIDLTEELSAHRTAEIQLQQLNVRLSYHDWLMFMTIMESFPKQAQEALYNRQIKDEKETDLKHKNTEESHSDPFNFQSQVSQLMTLGFSKEDCKKSLSLNKGQMDEAAMWLTENAEPVSRADSETSLSSHSISEVNPKEEQCFFNGTPISFGSLDVKTSSVNICIIDDCKDADVPLLELRLTHLRLEHDFLGNGKSSSLVAGNYYNRALSTWEPFLEPWKCFLSWKQTAIGHQNHKLTMNVLANEIINFNLTSTLLDLYHTVRANWTEDFYSTQQVKANLDSLTTNTSAPFSEQVGRRRAPFVPYVVHNDTGCVMRFCTLTKVSRSQTTVVLRSRVASGQDLKWREVLPGENVPLTFDNRGRLRHENPHDMKVHQIIVQVGSWQEVTPVSVDRVGTYFRRAQPMPDMPDFPPARVVFDVTLDGSARKMVTIRSALLVQNKLPMSITLMLENNAMKSGDVREMNLQPGEKKPVPLPYVWSSIFARPVMHQMKYCSQPINWYHIMTKEESSLKIHASNFESKNRAYRFAVFVRRLNYPLDDEQTYNVSKINTTCWIQPAHQITFLSPVKIINLLPCHLSFKVKEVPSCSGDIKPGKESFISFDTSEKCVFVLGLDQYPGKADLIIPPFSSNFEARVKLTDSKDRPLFLQVRVTSFMTGAISVTVYAPIWLINKTGLPLVFRQEDGFGSEIASGQDEEHELARMASPLMFSFVEREGNHSISMRVGSGLHPDGKPTWCRQFYVQNGAKVRRLRVVPKDNRAEWVYIIGIEVRNGKGRYRDTHIIILAPRFQLFNETCHKIVFSQQCFASSFHDPAAEETHLLALPKSSLAFHWPRLDKDQLLCIKLKDIADCEWSGGFVIEGVMSFHMTVRDISGRSTFIRVEITDLGATYYVILTDACNFPPPYRIDNFSEVPLNFHQTGVKDEHMICLIKPHYSVPYAWDEPTLPPYITCSAPGGSTAAYNMNVLGEGPLLTYENFIYITMTGTFSNSTNTHSIEGQQLVFDVEGTKVILAPKEAGKRSQLWRMTSTGMLQHEGSSPPQDPKKSESSKNKNVMVLDIGAPAMQPKTHVPLMLRKADDRRQLTQRWRFTEDGRLMSAHHNKLYVQAKDGFVSIQKGSTKGGPWQPWTEVVIGPEMQISYMRMPNGLPIEQAISRHKMRPGSGFLSVKVINDGPSRVLQINDARQKKMFARLDERDWKLINEDKRPSLITSGRVFERSNTSQATSLSDSENQKKELQLIVEAKKGIGLSLVNRDPGEELLYIFMSNVIIDYQRSSYQKILDGSIQNIQIDNQLYDSQSSIILFLSPMSKMDEHRHMPAVHFTANKLNNETENAEIYKHLMVTVKNITLTLEEELLFKVLKFSGITRSDLELEKLDENAFEAQRALIAATNAKRYYFGNIKLTLSQVKLSVIKSNKLSPDLRIVKRKLGLSLIPFEDANIELDPFSLVHQFETINFLTNAVIKHYQDELLSQAVLILGSTDFLGNPIGFFNDISEGVSGLVSEGNVGGLLKNVAHGAANSAAKVTGSISAGLSKVTLYERYDERRLMLRRRARGEKSKDHLKAGLKGLGFGVLGGLTSVVTETYDGVANEGVTGFFTGLGWGLIGTVSKPAIGVLDLATETASAVRESSRGTHKQLPEKMRPARLVLGLGGALPIFSEKDARGQEKLYRINKQNYWEIYVTHELLRSGEEDMQILVTSERIMVFTGSVSSSNNLNDFKLLMELHHQDLVTAKAFSDSYDNSVGEKKYYIQVFLNASAESSPSSLTEFPQRGPQIRCDSESIAYQVAQQINYARNMYEERTQAVLEDVNEEEEYP